MSLKQTLISEMKTSLKAGDKEKLGVIRLVLSDLKNWEIDHGQQDDAGVQKIIGKLVKQWQDALVDYKKANRDDLVTETQFKVKILQTYLPAQMPSEELKKIVQEVVAANPDEKIGPLIGQIMSKVKGQTDGGKVAALVKKVMN